MPKVMIYGATGGVGRQLCDDLVKKGVAVHLVDGRKVMLRH